MICPSCKGSGKLRGFVTRSEGCSLEEIQCRVCLGNGAVPEDFAFRLAEGERIRRERLDAGMTMREAAAARGLKVTEYSDLERGLYMGPSAPLAPKEEAAPW